MASSITTEFKKVGHGVPTETLTLGEEYINLDNNDVWVGGKNGNYNRTQPIDEINKLKEIYINLGGTDETDGLSKVQLLSLIAEVAKPIPEGSTALPIVETYPETDETKAGQRFWYKGNEWHYMTQDEIDSVGWTGLVNVGFPAPVSKVFEVQRLYITNTPIFTLDGRFNNGQSGGNSVAYASNNVIVDFLGLGNPSNYRILNLVFSNETVITSFINANLLINLENAGTTVALSLIQNQLSASTINNLFTQLPLTNKTATIKVTNNPGSATCDPTIATAKGYTVITS